MIILIDDTGRHIDFLEKDLSFTIRDWSDLDYFVREILSDSQYNKYLSDEEREFIIGNKKANKMIEKLEVYKNTEL